MSKFGAMLTVFAEEHADFIGIKLEGPFKPARTRSTYWQNTSMSKWRLWHLLAYSTETANCSKPPADIFDPDVLSRGVQVE